MDLSELGLQIQQLRKEQHLTQKELANLCNLHPVYIGQIERGEKNPTIESLFRICQALHTSLSSLLEIFDDREKPDTYPQKAAQLLTHHSLREQKILYQILENACELISNHDEL